MSRHETLVASIADLYRRTAAGEDVEHVCITTGALRCWMARPHPTLRVPTLVIERADSPDGYGAVRLCELGLPPTDTESEDEAERSLQPALAGIARAALCLVTPEGLPMAFGLDSLGLLVRIWRECAAVAIEVSRLRSEWLEAEWAADDDGGAAMTITDALFAWRRAYLIHADALVAYTSAAREWSAAGCPSPSDLDDQVSRRLDAVHTSLDAKRAAERDLAAMIDEVQP